MLRLFDGPFGIAWAESGPGVSSMHSGKEAIWRIYLSFGCPHVCHWAKSTISTMSRSYRRATGYGGPLVGHLLHVLGSPWLSLGKGRHPIDKIVVVTRGPMILSRVHFSRLIV